MTRRLRPPSRTALLLLLLLAMPTPAHGIDVDAGLFAAPHLFSESNELGQTDGGPGRSFDNAVGPGLRASFWLLDNGGLELETGGLYTASRHAGVAAVVASVRAHAALRARWRKLELFGLLGGGIMRSTPLKTLEFGTDQDAFGYAGMGAAWRIIPKVWVRADVRGHLTGTTELGKTFSADLEATLGIAWRFRAVWETDDHDGDGIPDDVDLCPHSAETFNDVRDTDGCPEDPVLALRVHQKLPDREKAAVAGQRDAVVAAEVDKRKAEERARAEAEPPPEQPTPEQAQTAATANEGRDKTSAAVPSPAPVTPAAAPPESEVEKAPELEELPPEVPLAPNALPPLISAGDDDGDGLVRDDDVCPDVPEDMDGFEDADGCPDEDNDLDGIPDARDKCPNDAESHNGYQDEDGCPDVVPKTLARFVGELKGVTFETGSARLVATSEPRLTAVVAVLKEFPDVKVEIGGHSDDTGTREVNLALSEERANVVRTWLISHGADAKRITARGYGSEKPKTSNATEEGRQQNRRVEFTLITKGPRTAEEEKK